MRRSLLIKKCYAVKCARKLASVLMVAVFAVVVLAANTCDKEKQEKPTDPNKNLSTADWQALSFYHRDWTSFYSIYVNCEGNTVLAMGDGVEVSSYAYGRIDEGGLASIQELLNAANIPRLKPLYSFVTTDDKLVRELDQFDLRFLCPDKRYVIGGELGAAPKVLRNLFNDLLSLVKDQTEHCDQFPELFLRAVPLGKGKETKKWIQHLRDEEVIVSAIDANKLNDLPSLAEAIEEEGSIVPCKEADLARKYLLGTGEAEVNGSYYYVEFFTKAMNAEKENVTGHKSDPNK